MVLQRYYHEEHYIPGTANASLPGSLYQGTTMKYLTCNKALQNYAVAAVASAMLLGMGGCSGMSTQDKNTAVGAGAGAVGGAVLTGGSTIGTAAGAVIGGVIGHEVEK